MRLVLMRNIQETVLEHEKFIIEKQDLIYLLSHDLKICRTAPTIINADIRGKSIK
jgi:predicted nucleic-acid-binding protein